MKKTISFLAALAVLAAAFSLACSMNDTGVSTPTPTAPATVSPARDSMADPSASPSSAPLSTPGLSPDADASGSPLLPSGSPDMSAEPASPGMSGSPVESPGASPNGENSFIDGFMEGKVVDPADIPEITAILGREFPEHTIQAATHELLDGRQAYRIVLQGEGELARMLYVLPNGTIVLPAAAD